MPARNMITSKRSFPFSWLTDLSKTIMHTNADEVSAYTALRLLCFWLTLLNLDSSRYVENVKHTNNHATGAISKYTGSSRGSVNERKTNRIAYIPKVIFSR